MSAAPSALMLSPRPEIDELSACMSGLRLDTNALYDQVSRRVAMPVNKTEQVDKMGPRGLALLMCHVPGATWRHFTNAFTNQALMRSFLQHFVESNENMVRQLKQMSVTVQTTFKNAAAGDLATRIIKSDRPVPTDQLWDLIVGISPNIAYYYLSEFADAERGSSPLNHQGKPYPMHCKVMLEVFVEEAYRTHLALIAKGQIKELQTAPALEYAVQQRQHAQAKEGKQGGGGFMASLTSIPSTLMDLLSASKEQQATSQHLERDAGLLIRHDPAAAGERKHAHRGAFSASAAAADASPRSRTPPPTPSSVATSRPSDMEGVESSRSIAPPAYSASLGPAGSGVAATSSAGAVLQTAPMKWFNQLNALKSAGLSTSIADVQRNIALLDRFDGDLSQVANAILAAQTGEPPKQGAPHTRTAEQPLISHAPVYPSLTATPSSGAIRVKQEKPDKPKRVCGYPCQTGSASQRGQPCQNPLADGEHLCGKHKKIANRCTAKPAGRQCEDQKMSGHHVCLKHLTAVDRVGAASFTPCAVSVEMDREAERMLTDVLAMPDMPPLQMRSSLSVRRDLAMPATHTTTSVY